MNLISQASLVISLSQFDASSQSCSMCGKCSSRSSQIAKHVQTPAPEEGLPLRDVCIALFIGFICTVGGICMSASPARSAGWCIVALLLVLQTFGIHLMW